MASNTRLRSDSKPPKGPAKKSPKRIIFSIIAANDRKNDTAEPVIDIDSISPIKTIKYKALECRIREFE